MGLQHIPMPESVMCTAWLCKWCHCCNFQRSASFCACSMVGECFGHGAFDTNFTGHFTGSCISLLADSAMKSISVQLVKYV